MIPEWLSFVDVVVVGVALLFAWGGFKKGFAAQLAHILTFLTMGVTLFFAYPAIFAYFRRVLGNINETYLTWLILAGAVVVAVVVFILISKLLHGLLKSQISDRSDKVYGFLLGLIRGALVAAFAMVFLVTLGSSKIAETFSAKAYFGKLVCNTLAPPLQPHLTRDAFAEKTQQLLDRLLEQEEAGILE